MNRIFIPLMACLLGACTATVSSSAQYNCYGGSGTNVDSGMPDWIKNNFSCVTAYQSTESGVAYYVFETTNVPPHKTPYWTSSSQYYESFPSGNAGQVSGFSSQNYKFKIRQTPTDAGGGSTVAPGVAAGVSTNGVVFFFGEASPGNTLNAELSTFDGAQGHPDGGYKRYHYHAEPTYIANYKTKLLGIMSDGYPIYGAYEEDGTQPSTTGATGGGAYPQLDSNTHGHTHATSDFPSGKFHYHIIYWDTSLSKTIATMPVFTRGVITISNVTF